MSKTIANLDTETAQLLDTLLETLVAGAIEGKDHARHYFAVPLVHINAHDTRIYPDRESYLEATHQIMGVYRRAGLTAIKKNILNIAAFGPDLFIVDVQWDYYDRNGDIYNTLFSSYTIQKTDGDLQIHIHISHNEALQRPVE